MRWSALLCLCATLAAAEPVALQAPILETRGDTVVFAAGDLAPGTVVDLYAPDDTACAGPVIARVQVIEVREGRAIAQVLTGAVRERSLRPRIEARPVRAVLRVRLVELPNERGLRPAIVAPALERVRAVLALRPGVRLVGADEPADLVLGIGEGGRGLRLRLETADGRQQEVTAPEAGEALDQILPDVDHAAVERQLAALRNPNPPFTLTVQPSQQAYRLGETMTLRVSASAPCHLLLLSLGATGRLTLLLPNRFRPSTQVAGGETLPLPDPAWGFHFTASAPVGEQVLKAIATRSPLDLPELRADDLGERPFRRLESAEVAGFLDRLAGALTTRRERDFDVVADDAWATAEVRVRIQP